MSELQSIGMIENFLFSSFMLIYNSLNCVGSEAYEEFWPIVHEVKLLRPNKCLACHLILVFYKMIGL